MKKRVFLLLFLTIIALAVIWLYINSKNPSSNLSLTSPSSKKDIQPSETLIDYTDPTGFNFSYPDNLSLANATASESTNPDIYSQIQLFSKDKNGSLTLTIADTKLKTLEDWLTANNISSSTVPVEKTLGGLKALEVKTQDRLLLGAIDKGVLFEVELPLIEQPFWLQVYDKLVTNFNFTQPDITVTADNTSSNEVTFEGEEIIE